MPMAWNQGCGLGGLSPGAGCLQVSVCLCTRSFSPGPWVPPVHICFPVRVGGLISWCAICILLGWEPAVGYQAGRTSRVEGCRWGQRAERPWRAPCPGKGTPGGGWPWRPHTPSYQKATRLLPGRAGHPPRCLPVGLVPMVSRGREGVGQSRREGRKEKQEKGEGKEKRWEGRRGAE